MTQTSAAAGDDGVSVLAAVRNNIKMFCVIVAGMTVLAGLAGWFLTPKAVSTTTIGLVAPGADSLLAPAVSGDASLGRYTAQRAQFAESDQVLEPLSKKTQLTLAALRRMIQSTPSPNANSFDLTVTGTTAEESVRIATMTVESYREATRADVIMRGDLLAEAFLAAGDKKQATLTESRALAFGEGVEFVEAATLESTQTRSIPIKEMALGFLIGIFAAALIVWFLEDARLRRARDQSL